MAVKYICRVFIFYESVVTHSVNIISLPTEGYASNTYLLTACDEAAIVDPSCETAELEKALEKSSTRLKYIILTHAHFDHMLMLDEIRAKYAVPLCIHSLDAPALSDSTRSLFAMIGYPTRTFDLAEILLEDGNELSLGSEKLSVIHTPGHTPGSAVFACGDILVTGDTLFDMSIGRCDFPGGDANAIMNSIFTLYERFPNSRIFPGHGAPSTVEKQKKYNPFTKRR